jgi:hypothetical protein
LGPFVARKRDNPRSVEEGELMKSVTAAKDRKGRRGRWSLRLLTVGVAFVLGLVVSGCNWQQPGETSAEVSRRHARTLRLNTQQMTADIDSVLLLDKPTGLTDKRIP